MSRISEIFDKLLGRKGNGASKPQAETQGEIAARKQAELKREAAKRGKPDLSGSSQEKQEEGDPEEQGTDEGDSPRP